MTKYQPLHDYLEARKQIDRVKLTFAEVAVVLGELLPPSAFKHREWWANRADTTNFAWTASWRDAGFMIGAFHQDQHAKEGWVEFVRNNRR